MIDGFIKALPGGSEKFDADLTASILAGAKEGIRVVDSLEPSL